MFTYFQKFFLIFLFVCIIAPIHAMKRAESVSSDDTSKANDELLQIIEAARDNDIFHFQEQDWENIKKCLEKGAEPNLRATNYSQTPLFCLAVENGKKNLCDYLLQLNANINATDTFGWNPLYFLFSKIPTSDLSLQYLIQNNANIDHKSDNGLTPLGWIIYKDKTHYGKNDKLTATIKELLQAKASIYIDDHGNTIFHKAAKNSKKTIKTLMTHINFKNNENGIRDTIKTVLLVFYKLNNDPKYNIYKIPYIHPEIQILILSKLLSPDFFHTGLYKKCKGENYQQLPFKLVNGHIQHLQQILKIKNKNNETALQKLSALYHPPYNPSQNIKILLDGSRLEQNLDILNKTYPNIASIHPDNLALQIFKNHYA